MQPPPEAAAAAAEDLLFVWKTSMFDDSQRHTATANLRRFNAPNPTTTMGQQHDRKLRPSSHSWPTSTTTTTLPRFQDTTTYNTAQQYRQLDTKQRFHFGRIPLTGSFAYVDDLGCTESQSCRIHFPYMDLKHVIPIDEAILLLQMTSEPAASSNFSENTISPRLNGNAMIANGQAPEPVVEENTARTSSSVASPSPDVVQENTPQEYEQEISFVPAIYTSQQSSSLDYQDFALLTRGGAKPVYENANVNQDRVLLVSPFAVQHGGDDVDRGSDWLLGLFDGHGKLGHVVSHFCALELPRVLTEQLQRLKEEQIQQQEEEQQEQQPSLELLPDMMRKILVGTILELDNNVPTAQESGTTGIVIWRQDHYVAVANTGDSRAYIVAYHPLTDSVQLLYETRPHKPHYRDERIRIEQLGGHIKPPARRGGTSRIEIPFPNSNVVMALAMSRSIGDHEGRNLGVIADPTVDILDVRQLREQQQLFLSNNNNTDTAAEEEGEPPLLFAMAATDGLLDFIPSYDVALHIAQSLFRPSRNGHQETPTLLEACEQVIMKASERWKNLGENYRDDISIVVQTIY